ncbi:MAG: PEP-CTERM sorting domain-containing protein [Verrucomicrobia bacterium]|nr:PEP-CTERM sorting domain-containing protein [Verrucomicrobiota bacterium]
MKAVQSTLALVGALAGGAPLVEGQLFTRFAVIGDYGDGGAGEASVAALVQSWAPDFIITTGDNNYPIGSALTIDANIGQFYHEYLAPYSGVYGPGGTQNRFFPSLGNHDWYTPGAAPYLSYFSLPGNERYYDFVWGPIHLFALDSDVNEPDGITATSTQAQWLEDTLALSTQPWRIVYLHHPPYSSGGVHGSTPALQWPFKEWGATAVLAGHDHLYERLQVDGLTYFVNGSGGHGLYGFDVPPLPESQARYNSKYGAMLVTADDQSINFKFYAVDGTLVDDYTVVPEPGEWALLAGLGLAGFAGWRRWARGA